MTDVDEAERPLTAKGRQTRDRIVSTAAELILAGGVRSFTIDAVRQAAGVSGSQISHYFVDRQALVRAVIMRQSEIVMDFHRQPALGDLDTFADFERWADLSLAYLDRIGFEGTPTFGELTGELIKADDAAREVFAAGYHDWVGIIEAGLKRMKRRGDLVRGARPRLIAEVLVSAHLGGARLAFTYRERWPLEDAMGFALGHLRSFASDPKERGSHRG